MGYEKQEVAGCSTQSQCRTDWVGSPAWSVVIREHCAESEYSVAGEIVPVSSEIQALLDTPTTQWDDISGIRDGI